MQRFFARQQGITLIIVLIGLLLLMMLGIQGLKSSGLQEAASISDELRQRVFQASLNEINAQIAGINSNDPNEPDSLILKLLENEIDDGRYRFTLPRSRYITDPENIEIVKIELEATVSQSLECAGFSIGTINVMFGILSVEARIVDSGIESTQEQQFRYCWPA